MAIPGAAVPGTVVPGGSLTSPGGTQGVPGSTAISTDANNLATFGSDGGLSVPVSSIWSARLRSYNALGNPNFEVDQRAANAGLTYAAGNISQWQADRWLVNKNAATAVVTGGTARVPAPNATVIPGYNFNFTNSFMQLGVSTAQASLAAGEYLIIYQQIEGSNWRELCNDVTSVSILCSCTVALNFSIFIRDNAAAWSLVIPCSITAGQVGNPFVLLTFPNLPLWTTSGTFSQYPGAVGYQLGVCLGAATNLQTPTTGSWVNGGYLGYAGMSNFMANSGATFQLRFLQHEPGPLCTTLIDKPFVQNYQECLRYYQKTLPYGMAFPNSTVRYVSIGQQLANSAQVRSLILFNPEMAKTPVLRVTGYNTASFNTLYLDSSAGNQNYTVSTQAPTDTRGTTGAFTMSSGNSTSPGSALGNWEADTGW